MKTNRRRLIIAVVVVAILVMTLTAAGVYAVVSDGGPLNALLGRRAGMDAPPVLSQDSEADEPATIYDRGVLVRQVDPESPAAVAGIRRGSIILRLDGVETDTPQALIDALAEKGGGVGVTLSVLNSATAEDISLTLADEAPYLGVVLVSDRGRFSGNADETCVCGFDFHAPEHLDELPHMPEEFHFERPEMLFGVFIREVVEDSPAAAAGLEVGDEIEAIDGEAINSVTQLVDLIGAKSPGDVANLSVLRGEESQEITVTLGANPEDESRAFLGVLLGSRMDSMRGRMEEMFPIGPDGEQWMAGAVIVEVVANSAAAESGLQQGDVIQAVDGESLDSVDALVALIAGHAPGDTVTLTIQRQDELQEILVKLGAHPDNSEQAYLGVQLGAFFNLHIERFEDGEQTAPGEFFFHMRPGDELNDFFDDHFRRQLHLEEEAFDA